MFRELGFDVEESENLINKSDLLNGLSELSDKRGWTQAQAARIMGVSQPRISNLVRGKIDLFSIDTPIAMRGAQRRARHGRGRATIPPPYLSTVSPCRPSQMLTA